MAFKIIRRSSRGHDYDLIQSLQRGPTIIMAGDDISAVAVEEIKDREAALQFMWRWVDRMARGEVPAAQCLSVLTHYPGAPDWVHRYKKETTHG